MVKLARLQPNDSYSKYQFAKTPPITLSVVLTSKVTWHIGGCGIINILLLLLMVIYSLFGLHLHYFLILHILYGCIVWIITKPPGMQTKPPGMQASINRCLSQARINWEGYTAGRVSGIIWGVEGAGHH